MKPILFISILTAFSTLQISCEANKPNAETAETTETTTSENEVWTEGITTITGTISSVNQEKDGQTIILFNNKGVEYTAVISIPNLGENAAQYRKFEVGENVGFKGNLIENQRMVVREVLETK